MTACWASSHDGACCCTCRHLARERHWLTCEQSGFHACTLFVDYDDAGLVMTGMDGHGLCEVWTPVRGPFLRRHHRTAVA